MDLQLWRWSTAVQLSSLVMIAAFFVALSRSVRRAELRWWVLAWCANLAALGVTLFFWYFRPEGALLPRVLTGAYMSSKTAFVLLFLQGAWALKKPGAHLFTTRQLASGLAAYALFTSVFVRGIEQIGVVQHGLMAVLLLAGALLLVLRPLENGTSWLAIAAGARALLSLVEAVAYGVQFLPETSSWAAAAPAVGTFLAAHSSFDSGAEWFLAISCVLALSERNARELRRTNHDLLSAQEKLRKLVDRDALTALANRRSLPEVFAAVDEKGATVLFFDLDDFKQINDLHGHQTGDECLKRFAAALVESFRPGDAVVRYAGDEFLVVAKGLDRASALDRVDFLRKRLKAAAGPRPTLAFSVGISELAPGGEPELALKAADDSMYRAKSRRDFDNRSLATA